MRKGITLVDIGTGTGLFAEAFLKLLPETRCYALDISFEMIDWIKDNRETYNAGRLIPWFDIEIHSTIYDSEKDSIIRESMDK